MRILVLNGSPRNKKSNTMHLTDAFIQGMNDKRDNIIETIDIINKNIKPCRGCFGCWTKTPGKCMINDDMEELIKKYINSDVVIWSFPLYYFGMPSSIKAFMDRLLPLNMPQIEKREDGNNGHPSRYDLSNQRYVLISTCGFANLGDNYEGVIKQFDKVFKDKYEKILCPQGELFNQPFLEKRKEEYLSYVMQAGKEYADNYKFSKSTKEKIHELLYDEDQFLSMANMYWESEIDTSNNGGNSENKEKNQYNKESYEFMKGMSLIYNKSAYKKDLVLEMYFTDLNERYQLIMKKDECILKTSDFIDFTTRIETTYNLWKDISNGKVNGAEAFLKRKYKVKGSFSILMKLDEYFK